MSMYLVDFCFGNFVSCIWMIFGGEGYACIISISPGRLELMCPAFHVIMVREVGVRFVGICVCCGVGGVMWLWQCPCMGFVVFISSLMRFDGMNGSSCMSSAWVMGSFLAILSLMRLYAIWMGGSCEW